MPKKPESYEKVKARQERYNQTDKGKARKAKWRAKNRQKMREYARKRYQEQKGVDPS
jgi:hypothetical protein